MEKRELRKLILKRRKKLSVTYYQKANQNIVQKIRELEEYKKSQMIFMFIGMEGEIDTSLLRKLAETDQKQIAVPRIYPNYMMKAHKCNEWENLAKNSFGIKEPEKEVTIVPARSLDLVILPCITCNKQGHRLGYGGGYYDRYLTRTKATKILPCYSKLQIDCIPTEIHDITADIVVTENEVNRVKNY